MSTAPRESTRNDAAKQAPTNNVVVPIEQRSQAFTIPEETGELSGGAASSQRTTRQSDLAPGLAAWDTRTSEPRPPGETSLTPPPPPPQDFKPFFALVEDPVTGEYHHPEVHYVFADDEDQGVLTHAALEAIDKEDNTMHEGEGAEERVAVIDMDYDGRTVLGVSSLSPEWQALRTEIWQAPGRTDGSRHGGTDRGLMLRVSGKEADKGGRQASGDVDNLMERFGRDLQDLDDVLWEEGEKGQEETIARDPKSQRPGSRVE